MGDMTDGDKTAVIRCAKCNLLHHDYIRFKRDIESGILSCYDEAWGRMRAETPEDLGG